MEENYINKKKLHTFVSTFSIKQKREHKVRERKQYQAACMQQQQFYRIESEKNMRKSTKRRKKEQWMGEEKQHIKLAYLISKEVTNTRDKKWTTKKNNNTSEEVGENMKEEENESETGVALNSQVNHHKRTPSWLFFPFPNWGVKNNSQITYGKWK